jgi:hypothetical protein
MPRRTATALRFLRASRMPTPSAILFGRDSSPCAVPSSFLFFSRAYLHMLFSFHLSLYSSVILYSCISLPFVFLTYVGSLKRDLPKALAPSLTFVPVSLFFHLLFFFVAYVSSILLYQMCSYKVLCTTPLQCFKCSMSPLVYVHNHALSHRSNPFRLPHIFSVC